MVSSPNSETVGSLLPFLSLFVYNLKMNSSKRKPGHHRQISKQFIKKNLLNDLYPIPRQRYSFYSRPHTTQTAAKIRNILEFLDFSHSEEVTLKMFREKVSSELNLSRTGLQLILEGVRAEGQIVNLSTRLVFLRGEPSQNILFLLRGLISTTYREIRQLIELLFFFHFLKTNQLEYRTIIREFQEKKIFAAISAINSQNSQLLTAKILSVMTMIYVKYGDEKRLSQIAFKTIGLRRVVEQRFFEAKDLNVDPDYASTTFYLSLKSTEVMTKEDNKAYQLLQRIHRELDIIKSYDQKDMIIEEARDIFVSEMLKLKNSVSSKVKDEYYHSNIDESLLITRHQRTKQALKQFKRKKSLVNFKQQSDLFSNLGSLQKEEEGQSQQRYTKSQSADKVPAGFRQIYNSIGPKKKMSKFIKPKAETNLKKSTKQGVFQFQSSKKAEIDVKQPVKSKDGTSNLFMKLGLFQYKHEKEEEEKMRDGEKQHKIQQIYQAFSNQNKILRDIPARNLQSDLQDVYCIPMGNKPAVKEMLRRQIIEFSAGLSITQGHFNNILVVKSCLSVEFLKVWLGRPFLCQVSLNLGSSQIGVEVVLNGLVNRIVLHRGNNVLCERYLTIWPTIRYLIHKKIAQLSIFKRYEDQLFTRKVPENNLSGLCEDFFIQKFGMISKEEIQEISTCLDNSVKLVLVLQHYSHKGCSRYDISKEYKYRISCPQCPQNAQNFKLNMLTEIYLNEFSRIRLCQLLLCQKGRFFYVTVYAPKERLLKTINNKDVVELQYEALNLESGKIIKGGACSLLWHDLQRNLIFHLNFIRFVKLVCSRVSHNVDFTVRFTNFLAQRLRIEDHPIFKGESFFENVEKQDFLSIYKKKNTQNYKNFSYVFSHSFKLHLIENEDEFNQVKYEVVQVDNLSKKIKEPDRIKTERKRRIVMKQSSLNEMDSLIRYQVKIWRQQRKIGEKSYLILVRFLILKEMQFEIEYTLINRLNESKDTFRLNHLDLKQLTELQLCSESQILSSEQQSNEQSIENQFDKAIDLSETLEFYYNHHIKKIRIYGQNGYYRHSFKEQRRKKYEQAKRLNRVQTNFKKQCLLDRFDNGCKFRIVKVVMAIDRYAMMTLKRNSMDSLFFWEIVLDYPRRHIQYVCQINQEDFICLISDHHRNSSKQFVSSRPHGQYLLESNIKDIHSSRYSKQSINISITSKQEQMIDYKEKILGIFERREIKVEGEGSDLKIDIRGDLFPLKQRIIEEWDHEKGKLYTVWLENNKIEVSLQYPKNQLDGSINSEVEQNLKGFVFERLGRIQLGYAYRFYEMENKEAEQDCGIVKVCQFYLDWCRQQSLKYQHL